MPMIISSDEKRLWRHGLPKCAHHHSKIVAITTAGGAQGRREQCQECGKLDTAVVPIALHRAAPAADDAAGARWRALERAAKEASGELAKKRYAMRQAVKIEDDATFWADYSEYLEGDDWQRQRLRIMRRDNGRCMSQLPGCTQQGEQVHHREGGFAYKFLEVLGATPDYLLVTICGTCHDKTTAFERRLRAKGQMP